MRVLGQWMLVCSVSACTSGPVQPSGVAVSAELEATVLRVGDSLRVRVTIANESAEPQRIVGVACQAVVDVYANPGPTRVAVSAPRMCILPTGNTTVPSHGTFTDVLTLATTKRNGGSNALAPGIYLVRGGMPVVGYGMLRSGFVTVTVSP
ncbi:MAG: hypothetical protein U0132_04915 [Gemmatimonadaceae bacterium]